MKTSSTWLKTTGTIILAAALLYGTLEVLGYLKTSVDTSYRSFPSNTTHPDSLLNHANTYFWWARYRKNTMPEFDTAVSLALKAQSASATFLQSDRDTVAYDQRMRQSRELIAASGKQAEVCRTNISSVIPFYMEIMGHDDDYMYEDADPDEVPNVALRGALARLNGLMSPERTVELQNLPGFILLNVNTTNPIAEEMLTQELNNSTRFYTISDHELVNILGSDHIDREILVTDTTSLRRIADAFQTREIAVLDFKENDRVNGIYYYGIRLNLWSRSTGWFPRNIYTEYMVRDRGFNQVTTFILPLLLAFTILAVLLNTLANLACDRIFRTEGTHPLYMLICFVVSAIIQYALVTFLLRNFLNPDPEDFYASDAGEAWSYVYPLTFILPVFLTYLVLGKLDNFITSFKSQLDRPIAIFAMIAGALLTIPCSMTFFQMLRFGVTENLDNWMVLTAIVLLTSGLAARYISRIVNFPESVHIAKRVFTWLAVISQGILLFLLIIALLTHYHSEVLQTWILKTFLPVTLLVEVIGQLVGLFTRTTRSEPDEVADILMPDGLEGMELKEVDGRLVFFKGGRRYASLYVSAKRGMDLRQVKSHFGIHKLQNCFVVDFSAHKPVGTDVHYFPFAKSFERELAFGKFNDVAEAARKTTNILGRLIAPFTNAGTVLIDERNTKARDPKELTPVLLSILQRSPSILLLEHLEEIDEENLDLLGSLIEAIQKDAVVARNHAPAILGAGYGAYGYRDRVLTLLEKLSYGQIHGLSEFQVRFTDPAGVYLDSLSAPIQLKLHLTALFRAHQRNDVPQNIKKTVEELIAKGQLTWDSDSGLLLGHIDQIRELPEIDHLIGNGHYLKGNAEVMEVMTGASYIADAHGRFHVKALAFVMDIETMRLMRILKEAEHQNLVYDLKSPDLFWWFEFTDKALISDFKHLENPRQERRSQLANEYIRRFVLFHCKEQKPSDNINLITEEYSNGYIALDLLWLLAQRSQMVHPAFPELAYHLNYIAAKLISNNAISHYDRALVCCNNCLEISKLLNDRVRNRLEPSSYELGLIEFRLLLETGRQKEPSVMRLVSDIRNACERNALGKHQIIDFQFLMVRYHFLEFSPQDQLSGKKLLSEISLLELDESEQIRTIFYGIKLVPGKDLNFSNPVSAALAFEVYERYEEILTRLENLDLTYPRNKSLYREVLNDYAGSFLSDKVLSIFNTENDAAAPFYAHEFLNKIGLHDPDRLFSRIHELLNRRLSLESPFIKDKISVSDAFQRDWLSALLIDTNYNIDKRGLCYTLNYMSRACSYTGKWEQCLQVSAISYRFNREIGDIVGMMMAAGVAAKASEKLANFKDAFNWYKRSFGHGWMVNHYSQTSMLLNMIRVANVSGDTAAVKLCAFYCRQRALSVIRPYALKEAFDDSIRLLLLNSTDGHFRETPAAHTWFPQSWLTDANKFLDGIHSLFSRYLEICVDTMNTVSVSFDDSEVSSASECLLSISTINISLPKGIEGKEMIMKMTSSDENVFCEFYRFGTDQWRLLNMAPKSNQATKL